MKTIVNYYNRKSLRLKLCVNVKITLKIKEVPKNLLEITREFK